LTVLALLSVKVLLGFVLYLIPFGQTLRIPLAKIPVNQSILIGIQSQEYCLPIE